MKRKVYLEDIPLDEARARFAAALREAGLWGPLGSETVHVAAALERVTARPVWARLSAPLYHSAAMDGYAVRSRETEGATETAPLRLAIPSSAKYLDTGDPLPEWADAVIPIEKVHVEEESIEIRAAVAPWAHVRAMGEDMVATELVIPANQTLRPVDLGAIAGCGHSTVEVWRKPRVAVIPTGSELVEVGKPVSRGNIIEYNSIVLAAQVESWGGQAIRFPVVVDDVQAIREAVTQAAQECDLVLLNAGSSAGSEDFTAQVVEALGTLLVHGIAVRPGHPVVMGIIQPLPSPGGVLSARGGAGSGAVPVIGVPGYPVSAALTGEIFVEPLLARWLGRRPLEPKQMNAVLSRKVLSPMGDDEYLRVSVGQVGQRVVATPLSRGAGVISSLVRADGIVRIPRFSEGHNAGDQVVVHLYRSPEEIARTIVAIGSHDLTLDLMSQFLAEQGLRLSSANVGSQGGLVALRRGESHLAGSHLLDPETGGYNVSYIRQYLPETPVVLVTLVGREQGLLVQKGNPKGIRTLTDLGRDDVTFVNRQRGAGTRVLLDFELGKLGIAPRSVRGYEHEEYTHLAVAAAVQSGAADCGLGIHAAAQALDLDFIPLFNERYDLVIPQEHHESSLLKPLLDLLHDDRFRQAVAALPGYDVSRMGEVVQVAV